MSTPKSLALIYLLSSLLFLTLISHKFYSLPIDQNFSPYPWNIWTVYMFIMPMVEYLYSLIRSYVITSFFHMSAVLINKSYSFIFSHLIYIILTFSFTWFYPILNFQNSISLHCFGIGSCTQLLFYDLLLWLINSCHFATWSSPPSVLGFLESFPPTFFIISVPRFWTF